MTELLDHRRIAGRFVRLLAAIAASQLVGQILRNGVIEPNFGNTTSTWLGSLVSAVLAVIAVAVLSGRALRRELVDARDLVAVREQEFEERNASQSFLRDVTEAFDMSEREDELFDAAAIALAMATVGRSELLVADASNAHLTRLVVSADREPPGCGVVTPASCPAARRGKTLLFGDPNGLGACPRLRERQLPSTVVAACIPVNVLGAPTAVLHSMCDDRLSAADLATGVRRLEGVAARFGGRLGLLRATARSRLQADYDPLTGLLNRRALENRTRQIVLAEIPFSMAMLDLDHFKVLNDTYGHETGDRALRLFARSLSSVMRENDIVARHGGEEFVVVLPHSDVTTATPVLHRVREHLRNELASAEVPLFTCSIGLVDSTATVDYFTMLRAADVALMTAKANGRDRIVIGDTLQESAPPVATPVTIGTAPQLIVDQPT